MDSIRAFMARGHKACDELFAQAEAAAGDWDAAGAKLRGFRHALEQHLAMEEDVLFPAFEEHTGMAGAGPTVVMRAEHAQMRALLDQLAEAVGSRDAEGYLGVADTLLVLMQQHNLKEEAMMYPMLDAKVGPRADELIARCRELADQAA